MNLEDQGLLDLSIFGDANGLVKRNHCRQCRP